jgi:hypothetical protein
LTWNGNPVGGGGFTLPSGGSSGQVLTSDGSGGSTWTNLRDDLATTILYEAADYNHFPRVVWSNQTSSTVPGYAGTAATFQTYTIGVNEPVPGRIYKIHASGFYHTGSSAPNFQIIVGIHNGSSTGPGVDFTTANGNAARTSATGYFSYDAELTFLNDGMYISSVCKMQGASSTTEMAFHSFTTSGFSINTAVTQTIYLNPQITSGDGTDYLTILACTVTKEY